MDREKVIKGLKCCLALDSPCGDCPYYSYEEIQELECERNLRKDAIAMLKEQQQEIWELQDQVEYLTDKQKEQEAVEPILIREGRNKHYNDYVCPRCDNEVVYEQNYCSECGVQFLWEGR